MFLLSILVLLACLLIDILFEFSLSAVVIKPQLCSLFIFYLLFRQSFKHTLGVLFLYLLFLMPFSGVSPLPLFLSFFPVLIVVRHIREQIFTESYIIQAFWVFVMSFVQQLLLNFLVIQDWHYLTTPFILVSNILNSLILGLITIAFFVICDRFYERVKDHWYSSNNIDPADSLRQKRYHKY
jgi:hypothetical protein